jgi:hypothetical protein
MKNGRLGDRFYQVLEISICTVKYFDKFEENQKSDEGQLKIKF